MTFLLGFQGRVSDSVLAEQMLDPVNDALGIGLF